MYGFTRLLTAGGTYTDISSIAPGTLLAGVPVARTAPARIVPVKVERLRKRKLTPGESVVTMRHDAFYDPLTCAGADVAVLMRDNVMRRTAWVDAEALDDASEQDIVPLNTFVLPPKVDPSPLSERQTILSALTYELGFVFGAFMRVGSLRAFPESRFVFDSRSTRCVAEVQRCVAKVFKAAPIMTQRGHYITLTFMSRYMYNIFTSFGTINDRNVPATFRKPVPEFASGLSAGLVTSGHAGLPRLTQSLHETLYFCSLASDKPLCYGQLEYVEENTHQRACFGRVVASESAQMTYCDDPDNVVFSLDLEATTASEFFAELDQGADSRKVALDGGGDDDDIDRVALVANNMLVTLRCFRNGEDAAAPDPPMGSDC